MYFEISFLVCFGSYLKFEQFLSAWNYALELLKRHLNYQTLQNPTFNSMPCDEPKKSDNPLPIER